MSNGKYSIYLQDANGLHVLYVAGHSSAVVTNATLTEELNDAGEFTFTVPNTNPCYEFVAERVKVILYKGVDAIWYGYIVSYSKNRYKELKVTCVGELSYFNDTIQPQAEYHGMTPKQLLTAYVNKHNNQSEEKFLVGKVTVTDPNDSVYRYTNYETTLTALREDLCSSLNGYLKIRHVGLRRYIDLVTIGTYGSLCNQFIEFGKNLLDYAEDVTANEIATACLPLGKQLETQEISGLTAYTTIKSVNDGLDYITSPTAVANYGTIKQVVHFDEVTSPSNLKTKAQAWLSSSQYAKMTLSLSAVDLSLVNVFTTPKKWKDYAVNGKWDDMGANTWADIASSWSELGEAKDWTALLNVKFKELNSALGNIDEFKVGDTVRCFALPYGMNAVYPIYSKTTYLQDPTKSNITLSYSAQKTFTKMTTGVSATKTSISTTEVGTITVPTNDDGDLYVYSTKNVYKSGILMTVNIIVSGTITSGSTLFTLPSGYRPSSAQTVLGIIDGASVTFSIPSTGIVAAPSAITTSAQLNFTIAVE